MNLDNSRQFFDETRLFHTDKSGSPVHKSFSCKRYARSTALHFGIYLKFFFLLGLRFFIFTVYRYIIHYRRFICLVSYWYYGWTIRNGQVT